MKKSKRGSRRRHKNSEKRWLGLNKIENQWVNLKPNTDI